MATRRKVEKSRSSEVEELTGASRGAGMLPSCIRFLNFSTSQLLDFSTSWPLDLLTEAAGGHSYC